MLRNLTNTSAISWVRRSRYFVAALFCLILTAVAIVLIPITRGANPTSGSVSESNPKVNWTGQIKAPTGDSDCAGPNNAGCDNFTVNFTAPSSSYGAYLLEIKLVPQGDWDMQVYGPAGNLLDRSGNSPAPACRAGGASRRAARRRPKACG